ncbi:MAG: polysaccharide biosynthesis protein [Chryseobacterium sp.]|nr:polysaccharide biosynthesis protein [Chryseobacterium sp.]
MKPSSLFSFEFKYSVLLYLQRFKKDVYFTNTTLDPGKRKAFFFLAADYGNLGDCAITVAQIKFIEKHSDFQVVEIPISQTAEGLLFTKKNISKDDIVVTVGGGNMGEMYDQIEFLRQLVFKSFLQNKIISFPQTFDFSESKLGEKALRKAQKVYSSHKNLHLIAREETSFNKMKSNFSHNYVYKTPDIVLSLNEDLNETRNGAVICMRSDEEKRLTPQQNQEVIDLIKEKFVNHKFYDTHIGKARLNTGERQSELKNIWKVFSNAELVITDRLHGMIFCHITNTPVLVFQNSNHKVKETYAWIKDNPNIQLVEHYDYQSIAQSIEKLKKVELNNTNLESKYISLINLLK